MKRSYISPEVNYIPYKGTHNMLEERSFFGSKMMDIEDVITIDNSSIRYFQRRSGEQLDLNNESSGKPIVFSLSDNKEDNLNFQIDENQDDFKKQTNTAYIMDINLKNIIDDYIFAQIKSSRVFEGIKGKDTKFRDIKLAIED